MNTQSTEVTLSIPNVESLGSLKGMEVEYNLTPAYRTKEEWAHLKDTPIRAFYLGTKEIPNEDGESIVCGIFATPTEIFLSAQLTLMERVKNLPPQTPIEIVFEGSKKNKSSNGSTMIFKVSKLK